MILVVGSTGILGGIITRRLLAEDRRVRILVRPQSKYQPLVEAGAQPVFGDLKDRPSLNAACQGIETLITTANSALRSGDDNPATVEKVGNISLIDAAKAAGVKQFIFVSVSGVDPASPIPFVAGKGMAEAHLQASGMGYTILAPGPFAEIWMGMVIGAPASMGKPVTLYHGGDAKTAFIAINDVASFAICAIGNPAALNQRVMLAGPQAYSFYEGAQMLGPMIGMELPVVRVNPGEPIPTVVPGAAGLMMACSFQPYELQMEETARTFQVQLATPQEQLASMLANPIKP